MKCFAKIKVLQIIHKSTLIYSNQMHSTFEIFTSSIKKIIILTTLENAHEKY